MLCLEIGPGSGPAKPAAGEEWQTLTADITKKADYHAVWGGNGKLPIESDKFDLVYASHVIEHVAWYRVHDALREVYRILRPGGNLEVWTVDFRYVVQCYLDNKLGDNWRRYNPQSDPMLWVNGRIFAYNQDDGQGLNFHKSCFDERHLIKSMLTAGFRSPTRLTKPRGEDHGKINLGIGATK